MCIEEPTAGPNSTQTEICGHLQHIRRVVEHELRKFANELQNNLPLSCLSVDPNNSPAQAQSPPLLPLSTWSSNHANQLRHARPVAGTPNLRWRSFPMTTTTATCSHQRPLTGLVTTLRTFLSTLFLLLLLLYALYSSQLFFFGPSNCSLSSIKADTHLLNTNSSSITSLNEQQPQNDDLELNHIVFCIAASSNLWDKRKEYLKLWWRNNETCGVVWLDQPVNTTQNEKEFLPEIHISGDTSDFKYTNKQGMRSALRISRVVSETLRLGLKDVKWFVMGDDDTVFVVDNLVRVLSKYDHRQLYYIGSSSESHIQNIFFSYSMAFGGGGFAISYPLAKELEKMQDACIRRYPNLYGSDDRMQACMAELGVPLTREAGFHQYDVYGNLLGLLGAHPVTPLVSLHHLDVVHPIFPRMDRVQALRHLFDSTKNDTASAMQQSICYDSQHQWSVSVSFGYVVQIIRGVMTPRELEKPTRTFLNWYPRADYTAYAFNTRPVTRHPCQKPFLFYMKSSHYNEGKNQTIGVYSRDRHDTQPFCRWRMDSPDTIDTVVVMKRPDSQRWKKSPRRDCCRVLPSNKKSQMYVWVGNCGEGEVSEW